MNKMDLITCHTSGPQVVCVVHDEGSVICLHARHILDTCTCPSDGVSEAKNKTHSQI